MNAINTRLFTTNKLTDEALDRAAEPFSMTGGMPFTRLCWAPEARGDVTDEALDRPSEPLSMTGGMPFTRLCWAPEARQDLSDEALDRPDGATSLCVCSGATLLTIGIEREEVQPESSFGPLEGSSALTKDGRRTGSSLEDEALDRSADLAAFTEGTGGPLCHLDLELDDEAIDRPAEVATQCATILTDQSRPDPTVTDEALDRVQESGALTRGCGGCFTPQLEPATAKSESGLDDEALDRPMETISLCCSKFPKPEVQQDLDDEDLDRPDNVVLVASFCPRCVGPRMESTASQGPSGEVVRMRDYKDRLAA